MVTNLDGHSLTGISQTSSSLIERAQVGDAVAWDRLVTLYTPLVARWCRRYFGLQPTDAENVEQETFTAAYRGLPEFRRDQPGHSFRGWLFRIASNKHIDLRRKQKSCNDGSGGTDAYERMANLPDQRDRESELAEETQILFQRAVTLIRSEFSEQDWQAFSRVVMGGERPADVAAALDITKNSVYLAKSRILSKLRTEFADLIDLRRPDSGAD